MQESVYKTTTTQKAAKSSNVTARDENNGQGSQTESHTAVTSKKEDMKLASSSGKLTMSGDPQEQEHPGGHGWEEWRGQNLRETVGNCEIGVGRQREMHKMKQCSCALLDDAMVPQWFSFLFFFLPEESWMPVFCPSLLRLSLNGSLLFV